jgi:hypothetical protein
LSRSVSKGSLNKQTKKNALKPKSYKATTEDDDILTKKNFPKKRKVVSHSMPKKIERLDTIM